MSTDKKMDGDQRAFLILVGCGIWLPMIAGMLSTIVHFSVRTLTYSGFLLYYILMVSGILEMGAIFSLMVYLALYKSWRVPGKEREALKIHFLTFSFLVLLFAFIILPSIV